MIVDFNISWWLLQWYILSQFSNLFYEIALFQFSASTLVSFGHHILNKDHSVLCCYTPTCNIYCFIILSLYNVSEFMCSSCLLIVSVFSFSTFFLNHSYKEFIYSYYFQRTSFLIFILFTTVLFFLINLDFIFLDCFFLVSSGFFQCVFFLLVSV